MKTKCSECFIHVSGEDPLHCTEEWCKDAEEYFEGAKNTEQQVQADGIDNMPDACKKCWNRCYDICPATNCQFHSLTQC